MQDLPSLPGAIRLAGAREEANLWLAPSSDSAGEKAGIGRWIYVLAAPFATVADEVSAADLRLAWQGKPPAAFAGHPLLLSPETLAIPAPFFR